MIRDLSELWLEGGAAVMRLLMSEDPATFAKLAFSTLPRDVLVKVEQAPPGNLDPDSWATLRSVLDLIQRFAPDGAEPGEVFSVIEDSLRAFGARTIEHASQSATPTAIPPPPC